MASIDVQVAATPARQQGSSGQKLKRTSSLNAGKIADPTPEPVLTGRQLYNSRRFHYKHQGQPRHPFSGSTQSLHQSISRDSSPPGSRFSDRSISPEDLDGPYRRRKSERRYESDYEDHRFSSMTSSSSSGRHQQYHRPARERPTAAALENRRRMFERENADRRWDYSDSYSDVEFSTKRRHPSEGQRSAQHRDRVTEYRRYFQQMASNSVATEDFNATLKPSMRRQASADSSYNNSRRYPNGQFELYRSRFESRAGRETTSSEKSAPNSRGGSMTSLEPPGPPQRIPPEPPIAKSPVQQQPVHQPVDQVIQRKKSSPAYADQTVPPVTKLDELLQVC